MKISPFIIPKNITGNEDLVVLPRKEFEQLMRKDAISEHDVLKWSKEAKKLKKENKLQKLRSLKDF